MQPALPSATCAKLLDSGDAHPYASPVMPIMQINQQVHDMLEKKVKEYKLTNGHNRPEMNKGLSKHKIVDYAVQMLEWVDTHLDDPTAVSILEKFKYESQVRMPGRPSSVTTTVSRIGSMVMQECVKRAQAAGLDPMDDTVIFNIYSNLKLMHGGRVRPNKLKNAQENKQRIEQLRRDPNIVTLEDETKRIKAGKNRDGTTAENDWS